MPTPSKIYSILVIEDNQGDFILVEEFLSEQVDIFVLVQAKNFAEAQKILLMGAQQFDAILLDLSLPDKTGLPLIKEIVPLSLNVPIIILTGYTDVSFSVKSLSEGITDYLLKDDLTPNMLYKSIVYSSERKKAIVALERSEKQYSELFHLSPQPMYVFELATLKFLDVNDAFIKQYGYTREELSNMDLKQIRPPEEVEVLEAGILTDSKAHKNHSLGIYIHKKKNGDIIQVDIQANFIDYKGKNAKVTIATDVTERLNYIKAIETQNEKLREISWVQSHLVRAPVARILGLVSLINDIKIDDIEKGKMLAYLLLSANELDEIIKGITEKTNIEEDNNDFKSDMLLCYSNYL